MTRSLIISSNRLHPAVAKRLQAVGELHAPQGEAPMTADEMRPLLARAHAFMGFMTDRVDRTWLEQAPELRIVAAALKGFDNYDVQACEAAGVWLSIVPDLLTEPTAELALGLAIALGRHLREGDHRVRSGEFSGWRPVLYGTGLAGATVGVVGLGAVGGQLSGSAAG
jgi:phosphonate dehydrogenase